MSSPHPKPSELFAQILRDRGVVDGAEEVCTQVWGALLDGLTLEVVRGARAFARERFEAINERLAGDGGQADEVTYTHLARYLDVSRETLGRWFNHDASLGSAQVRGLVRLLTLLGVCLHDIPARDVAEHYWPVAHRAGVLAVLERFVPAPAPPTAGQLHDLCRGDFQNLGADGEAFRDAHLAVLCLVAMHGAMHPIPADPETDRWLIDDSLAWLEEELSQLAELRCRRNAPRNDDRGPP